MQPDTSTAPSLPFQDDLRTSLQTLRGALTELFAHVGADPGRPPEVAIQLGLSRTLAWRAAKIVQARDVTTCVQYVPRRAGMRTLLKAFERRGAKPDAIERGRDAFESFERMVSTHGGDRETLELLAGNLNGGTQRPDLLEHHRKLAFQGNSATIGVQAGTLLSTFLLVPGAEGLVDVIQVVGLVSFRRLRPDVRWQFFRISGWNSLAGQSDPTAIRPLDPSQNGAEGVPLLREFCSDPLPDLESDVDSDGALFYELPEGPIGQSAALDCIYAAHIPNAGAARSDGDPDSDCRLCSRVITPVEHLQFDVLVHDDLGWMKPPTPTMTSLLGIENLRGPLRLEGRMSIPFAETVHELGRGLDTMAAPQYSRYRELLETVFRLSDYDPGSFRAHRFSLDYPHVPSMATLRFELPG
jgi:hypothetical protein